jgi:hypothetical protein
MGSQQRFLHHVLRLDPIPEQVCGKAQAGGMVPGHELFERSGIPRDRTDHQLGIGHRAHGAAGRGATPRPAASVSLRPEQHQPARYDAPSHFEPVEVHAGGRASPVVVPSVPAQLGRAGLEPAAEHRAHAPAEDVEHGHVRVGGVVERDEKRDSLTNGFGRACDSTCSSESAGTGGPP